ncbi:MAG: HAD family phosphatase [Lachnospiraceae bacterium]|nr:HAD family phosphatase [Lachnospiraceae bacterium]
MLKAIIFDMDGVLVDSEPVHMEAFKRLAEGLGIAFERDYYLQFVGSTTDHMWNKVIADYDLKLSKDELMELSNQYVREINGEAGYPVMAGAAELIRKLADSDLKLAVASSSGMERIESTLDKLGVKPLFDGVVSGMQVANPKPAPDTFLAAATMLGVNPDECIVIEDSLNGMKAAKHAGMICVMYENLSLGSVNSSYADYIIQGFEELDASFFEMIYAHMSGEP